MNYIYDIYLNLNEVLYDFFDWNKSDKLIHIKKIPIFKISEENFKMCVHNSIKINNTILNNVYNKTEVWDMCGKINYCALFCDNNNIISIEFNENGESIKKSYLLIEEELEILETTQKLKESNIEFKILKQEIEILKTRKQIQDDKFIKQELKNIKKDKLNYIYYECFGKQENNKKNILNKLNKISKNSKLYKNLYDILKLTSTTKNKML